MRRDSTRYEKVDVKVIGEFTFRSITMSSGRVITASDALREAKDARTSLVRWLVRAFKLSEGIEWDEQSLQWLIEELDMLVEAWKEEIDKRHGKADKRELIAQLRNTTGRTDEEARIFLAKADELERQLDTP